MRNNVLVLGGNGKTGRRIVDRLQKKGITVRVGSRSASPAFDWHQPEAWPAVLEGVEAVYISYQPDLAVPGAKEAIEQLVQVAKEQDVQKLVLLSGKGEAEAEKCEQIVLHSGIDSTVVRASWFNQNFSESFFLEPIQQGVVALPKAEVKVPYVDANDIADVAVEVLLNEGHTGKIYELTGDQFFTFKEVVAEIAKATNRNLTFVPVTLEAYLAHLEGLDLPSGYVWLIEYLFTEVLGNPKNQVLGDGIQKVLGRKPIAFTTYIAETAQTGIWNATVTA